MKIILITLSLLISIKTYADEKIVVQKVYEDPTHLCFAPTWKKQIADIKTPLSCVTKPSEADTQKLALEIELLKIQIAKENKKK